jgi:hypothetical protein
LTEIDYCTEVESEQLRVAPTEKKREDGRKARRRKVKERDKERPEESS